MYETAQKFFKYRLRLSSSVCHQLPNLVSVLLAECPSRLWISMIPAYHPKQHLPRGFKAKKIWIFYWEGGRHVYIMIRLEFSHYHIKLVVEYVVLVKASFRELRLILYRNCFILSCVRKDGQSLETFKIMLY